MKRLLYILVVLLLFSCKKEDGNPPQIEVTAPFQSSYNFGQQIQFSANLSDETQLESAVVAVFNSANQQVLATKSFGLFNTYFEIDGSIIIDDIYLPTGDYYLQFRVSDGTNESLAIREFKIFEAPRELIEVIGFNQQGSNMLEAQKLQNNQWQPSFILPLQLVFIQPDYYAQSVLIAGNTSDGLNAIRMDDGVSISSTPAPFPLSDILWNDATWHAASRTYWLACKDGSVRAFSGTGSGVSQFNIIGNFFPKKIAVTDSKVIVATTNQTNSQFRIEVYQKSSGMLIHSTPLSSEIQWMNAISEDNIWIYQSAEEYKQNIYKVSGNYIDEWTNFRFAPSSEVTYAHLQDSVLFIQHTDGLRRYSLNGNIVASGSAYLPSQMTYDNVNNQLYVIQENDVRILNAQTLQESSTLPGVDRIVLRFNK